jgi:hypothetical protein
MGRKLPLQRWRLQWVESRHSEFRMIWLSRRASGGAVHAFDYVMALAAVIVGLALTHMLAGVTRMFEGPTRPKLDWVHLIWLAGIFITVLLWWWAEFQWSTASSWTFAMYLFVLTYAVLLFLMSAALVPANGSGLIDYRDLFDGRKKWFLSLIIAYVVIDFIDSALKGTSHLRELGWQYMLSEIATLVIAIAAMLIRSRTFQGAVAIAFLLDQLWLGFLTLASIR